MKATNEIQIVTGKLTEHCNHTHMFDCIWCRADSAVSGMIRVYDANDNLIEETVCNRQIENRKELPHDR